MLRILEFMRYLGWLTPAAGAADVAESAGRWTPSQHEFQNAENGSRAAPG
jgi:hypothetical protein